MVFVFEFRNLTFGFDCSSCQTKSVLLQLSTLCLALVVVYHAMLMIPRWVLTSCSSIAAAAATVHLRDQVVVATAAAVAHT